MGGADPNASLYSPPMPLVVLQNTIAGSTGSTSTLLIERPVKHRAPMMSVVGVGLNGPLTTGAVSALSMR